MVFPKFVEFLEGEAEIKVRKDNFALDHHGPALIPAKRLASSGVTIAA